MSKDITFVLLAEQLKSKWFLSSSWQAEPGWVRLLIHWISSKWLMWWDQCTADWGKQTAQQGRVKYNVTACAAYTGKLTPQIFKSLLKSSHLKWWNNNLLCGVSTVQTLSGSGPKHLAVTDGLLLVQGVIPLVSLNHLNAQRVAHCANGVYNPAFHHSTPRSKRWNEATTFQPSRNLLKGTPAGHKHGQWVPNWGLGTLRGPWRDSRESQDVISLTRF